MAKLTKKEKVEVIKALTEANVKLDGDETDSQLIKLAEELEEGKAEPKAENDGKAADEVEETEENDSKEDEDDSKPAEKEIVDIVKGDNIFVRYYSKKIHGKDFKKMAEEFIANPNHSKRGYKISDVGVNTLVVRYREKEDYELPKDKQKPDAPEVDKERSFTDRDKALAFANLKHVTVAVSKKPAKQ